MFADNARARADREAPVPAVGRRVDSLNTTHLRDRFGHCGHGDRAIVLPDPEVTSRHTIGNGASRIQHRTLAGIGSEPAEPCRATARAIGLAGASAESGPGCGGCGDVGDLVEPLARTGRAADFVRSVQNPAKRAADPASPLTPGWCPPAATIVSTSASAISASMGVIVITKSSGDWNATPDASPSRTASQ